MTWDREPPRSANPNPVCRRAHCSYLADEDGEWCPTHHADIETARRNIAAQRAAEVQARKRQHRSR